MSISDKTGSVIAIKAVAEEDDLMITTKSGIIIRMPVNDIRVMGRATQGVKVIRVNDNDQIADVAVVTSDDATEDAVENVESSENETPESDIQAENGTPTEGTEN